MIFRCGNVNWARRHMCNICNAPKLADLEVRTGYGGGYMDREDVRFFKFLNYYFVFKNKFFNFFQFIRLNT
jgi:hypothetical protein